ncbi:helix-turn-helix domain-containing protein [Xanthobacter sp. DSM 24535]|uniref:helix-turn-helix domain-containing protein n=1 Tax=Roseixanthobacter psychrophilus TaxID=3119917 RepID=UPI0037288A35
MHNISSPSLSSPARKALRIPDAADQYGIGRSTIYNLLKQGKLRDVKIAGRRLVLAEDMDRLIYGEG